MSGSLYLLATAGFSAVVWTAAVQRRELLDAHLLVFHVFFEHPANGGRDLRMG
jgi:hypothetical protein